MLKIIELIFSKHEYEIGDDNYKRFLNKKFLKRVDNVFYSLYYDNEFKKLIYEFKYRRLKYIAKFIASLINKDINFIIKKYNIDNIIAVPLNINRLRQRGFNQTELILEELGISNTKVKRVENTIKMSKIKENYLKVLNVQKAFDVNNLNLDNKKILIFDDLITSGATTMRLQKEIQKVYKNTQIYIYAIALSKKYEKELADAKIIQCFKKNKALNHAMTLLSWDLETQAPKNGVTTIADTMEVLSEMSYKLTVNDEFKNLLYSYNVDELSEIDKKIVEKLKETIFEKTSKIPIDEYSNYQSLIANSNNAWEYAKENNDFNHFKPYLEKLILTNKKFIGYIGYKDHPYNKLLDDYEKGITVEYCDKFFNKLKTELSPFIIKVQAKKDGIIKPIKEKFDKVVFSVEEQKKISIELAKILGFDFTKGVLSESEHPFTTNMSNKDVRMTTHYYLNDVLSAIYSTCHETGHSIYEQQISDEISDTIVLAEGASMGMHEAQSRLYENVLCKLNSFTDIVYDILSKYHKLPITKAEFYILVNEVKHQYIRIEADELTYPMRVLIRYEIEKDMFSNLDNNINVDELSKKWDNLYEKYLGIRPKDYKQGILQDSHWAAGLFGYFPSYALGSAYASQIYDSMIKEIDVEKDIANRDFSKINEFLREKIHKFGASKTPEELLNICTNKNFDENHYIKYLINKYSSIYNVED